MLKLIWLLVLSCLLPLFVSCAKKETVVNEVQLKVDRSVVAKKKNQIIFLRAYRPATMQLQKAVKSSRRVAKRRGTRIVRQRRLFRRCKSSQMQNKRFQSMRAKKARGTKIRGVVSVVGFGPWGQDGQMYRMRKQINGEERSVYLDVFGEGQVTRQCDLFTSGKKYQIIGSLRKTKIPYVRRTKRGPNYLFKVKSWKEIK